MLFSLCTFADAQRKVEIVEPVKQGLADAGGRVIKRKVAIGRFSNETQYAKGIFYDKENDPMRKQALDILSAKLAASGKFLLLERDDLASLLEEAEKIVSSVSHEDKEEKILENQQILVQPIVRNGKKATVGYQPDIWKSWD